MAELNPLIEKKINESKCKKEVKDFLMRVIDLELKAHYEGKGRYSYKEDLRQLIKKYCNEN